MLCLWQRLCQKMDLWLPCDNDPVAIAFAKKYFSKSPHGKKIKQMEGPGTGFY